MNEELISFETARLAKAIGFNEDCKYGFYMNSKTGQHDLVHDNNINQWLSEVGYSVPTKLQLQKWLRETYNIHVYALCNFFHQSPLLGYIYQLDRFDEYNIHIASYDTDQFARLGKTIVFNSYEEALEAGLYKGLKLIQNEKDKD